MDLLALSGSVSTAVQPDATGSLITWPVTTFLVAWVVILLVVSVYGVHRWSLVYLYYKHRRNLPKLQACFSDLPPVTIQLPMFNEQFVARRIIENTCKIDYPKDKLQIQVLDDSTDDTVEIAGAAVAEMRGQGFDIDYIHRTNREGYKAGALCEGLKTAKGEFVAIFDADFIPPPRFPARADSLFHRLAGRHGPGPLGAHQPRAQPADQDAGHPAGWPLCDRARRPPTAQGGS